MCETNRIPVGDRVTIYPRGKKKIYVADFWHGNVHKRISLRTANKKIATERAKKLEAELVCGVFQTTIKEISFSDAVEGCLTGLKVNDRAKRTIVQFRGKMRLFGEFLSRRSIKTLGQITGLHLDQFRSERKMVKKDRSVFNDADAVLRLLRWAFNHGLIRENPLARYNLKKPRFSPKPAPSLAQVEAILAAAKPAIRLWLVTLAFTGMRVGELQRLRPEDIDLDGNWINIVSRPGFETKTKQSRKVPIHPRLRAALVMIPKTARRWFFTAQPSK